MIKQVKVSKRARLKLTQAELTALRDYTGNLDNAPYATIKETTGIHYKTVKAILAKGSADRDAAIRMREFIKRIPQIA